MKDHLLLSVPIRAEEVPEGGRDVSIDVDAATRQAIARAVSVIAVPRLSARFHVRRRGAGVVNVVGTVSASVEQNCVVTLESMTSEISEQVDIVFDAAAEDVPRSAEIERMPGEPYPPEPLVDGIIDLGEIATDFLFLGIDPYPRKPDAVFAAPTDAAAAEAHPFSALAALKKQTGGNG